MSTDEISCDCPSDCPCAEPEVEVVEPVVEEPEKPLTPFANPLPYGPYRLGKRFRRVETKQEMVVWDLMLYANRKHVCSWIIVLLYHLFFYVLVFLFFTTLLFLFLSFLPNDRPIYSPSMPGLSYSPTPLSRGSNAIVYKENDHQDVKPYVFKIDEFLDQFGKTGRERFLNCNLDGAYGYASRQPCIFIKLNRMLNFKPMTYNEAVSLPPLAPNELYEDMLPLVTGTYDNRIWLSCSTIEPLPVIIDYVPERFYEAEAFEHPPKIAPDSYDRAGYNDTARLGFRRIVAIKLLNLPVGQMVTIKCTVWAKNIPIDYNTQGNGILYLRVIVKHPKLRWVGEGMYAP